MSSSKSTWSLSFASHDKLSRDRNLIHLLSFLRLSSSLQHLEYSRNPFAVSKKRLVKGVQCSSRTRNLLMEQSWSLQRSFHKNFTYSSHLVFFPSYTCCSSFWRIFIFFSPSILLPYGIHKLVITRQETALWIFFGSYRLHTSAHSHPYNQDTRMIQLINDLRNFLLSFTQLSDQVSVPEYRSTGLTHSHPYLCQVLVQWLVHLEE